jgi:catechol 2,3-dioxygenase-like lactoylglutathione lyase family enzyme
MDKKIVSESVTVANKLTMVNIVVGDMKKAKEFYAEKLGLAVVTDYRQNDDNWWVSFTFPGGGATITLARTSTTDNEPPKPGTVSFYFSTPDLAAAHKELNEKGLKTGEIMDNLYGPGSGVKFFQLKDPDGNLLTFAQE